MKKLLIFLIILVMATLTNADLILTINGVPVRPEITICPSDIIEIDMDLVNGENCFMYDVAFRLSNVQASLDWSSINFPTVFDIAGGILVGGGSPAAQYVRVAASQIFSPPVVAPKVLVNQLSLHCGYQTPVILDLVVAGGTKVDDVEIPIGTILDSVLIHQIPEPATILLLGLGGMTLLRKRKT